MIFEIILRNLISVEAQMAFQLEMVDEELSQFYGLSLQSHQF